MTKTAILYKGQEPTGEQVDEIEDAKNRPIVFDDDSPELTSAMEKAFVLAAKSRNRFRSIS